MKNQHLISALAILMLVATTLAAQAVPGRWEKIDTLSPGKKIVVTLKAGDRMECVFKSSGPGELTLIDPDGIERRYPKSEVRKIVSREKYKDAVLDGTLIGFASGAGGYLAVHAPLAELQAHDFPAAIVFGAVGALVGYLVDKRHKGTEILYRAP